MRTWARDDGTIEPALVRATGVRQILVHTQWLSAARRAPGYAPYHCPPHARFDAARPGTELGAWRDVTVRGRRTDLQLVASDTNGDLLFVVGAPSATGLPP